MHHVTELAPGVRLLSGVPDECCIYLVEGTERALLIDPGFGIGDIRAEAASLTSLPLTAVNTHGHGDHSGGDMFFDTVYMHPAAEEDARGALELNRTKLSPDQIREMERILANGSFRVQPIGDGFVFDLGGRELEVIEIPGHTSGCIALLDRKNRLLFSGDCALKAMDILLVVPQALSVAQYLESMKKLQLQRGYFDWMCTGHDEYLMPASFLDKVVACAEKIVSGALDGEPLELPPVFGDTHARRVVCGDFAIAYRPGKIH